MSRLQHASRRQGSGWRRQGLSHALVARCMLPALLALAPWSSAGMQAEAPFDRLAAAFASKHAPRWWTAGTFEDARLLLADIRWDRCIDHTGKTWPLDPSFAALAGQEVTAGIEILLPGDPYIRDRNWDEHMSQILDSRMVISPRRASALARAFPEGSDLWLSVVPYIELSDRRYWLVPGSATRTFGFEAYFPDCDGGMAKTARVPEYVHYYPSMAISVLGRAQAKALASALLQTTAERLELVDPVAVPATDLAELARMDRMLYRVLAPAMRASRWPWVERLSSTAASERTVSVSFAFSFPGADAGGLLSPDTELVADVQVPAVE